MGAHSLAVTIQRELIGSCLHTTEWRVTCARHHCPVPSFRCLCLNNVLWHLSSKHPQEPRKTLEYSAVPTLAHTSPLLSRLLLYSTQYTGVSKARCTGENGVKIYDYRSIVSLLLRPPFGDCFRREIGYSIQVNWNDCGWLRFETSVIERIDSTRDGNLNRLPTCGRNKTSTMPQ